MDRLVVLRRMGSREMLNVTLMEPGPVVEVGVARDASSRWHHPARRHAGTPHAPASPPPTFPASLTRHRRGGPGRRATG
ncbi:hypothetical protein [Streptomyces sp. NPDC058625]|uniref:hypothetical protein n=1 Tax=Streptomyces sp. NPDC058625 TaxID=3346564 RepID=UPI003656893B